MLGEMRARRQVEPAALDAEALDLAAEQAEPRQAEQAAPLMARLQRRAEDARQVADILGGQEVVLHEALDAERAGMVGVAHSPRELRLDVEGQPFQIGRPTC